MTTKMTDEQARATFDALIAATPTADRRADLELCREFFLNADFRAELADQVFAATYQA